MGIFKKYLPILFFLTILASVSSTFLYFEEESKIGLIRINKILGHDGNNFDDLSLITAIKNYEKDGFLSNYLISNRKGHTQQSYWSVPCHYKDDIPLKEFKYKNLEGIDIDNSAIVNDCFYTRSPPLPEILYYGFFLLTGKDYFKLKYLSLIISILSMIVLYLIMRVFFEPWPSALALSIIALSRYYYIWMFNLYNIPLNSLLFFLSVLFVLKSKNKVYTVLLCFSSFLLGYTSNESVIALFFIALFYPYLKSKEFDFKKPTLIFISVTLSVITYQLQKLLFFGSFEKVISDLTRVYGNRYIISEDFVGIVKKMFQDVGFYTSTEIFPLAALVLIALVVPKTKRIRNHLLLFFIAGLSFSIVFYKVAYFHYHIFYKHFIILFVYILALGFTYILKGKKKVIKVVVFGIVIYGLWKNTTDLLRYEIQFNREVLRSMSFNKDKNKAHRFLDVIAWQKAPNMEEFFFSWRYRMVDGIEPLWKYYHAESAYPIYKDSVGEIDLYLLNPEEVTYVGAIVHKDEFSLFRMSCELYTIGLDYSMNHVEHKNSREKIINIMKTDRSLKDEVDTNYLVAGWKFPKRNVLGIRLACESTGHLQIHELRIK